MSQPSGLGRGLSSLIPSKKSAANFVTDTKLQEVMETSDRISELPVEKIFPNPHQPRQSFDEGALVELGQSLKEYGILQPLIVTKSGFDAYELVAGERRLKAAKLIGLKTVPAVIREMNEQKKLELALIENLQREDLNPMEIALAYQKLRDEFNLNTNELAKKVGRSASLVQNYLRLLNLTDEVKSAIVAGKLTEGHARTLVDLPKEDQLEGMNKIIEGKFSVREAEKAKREVVAKKNIRPNRFDPEAKDWEDELAALLSTKVDIHRKGGVGAITIKFFSNGELKEIMKKIL